MPRLLVSPDLSAPRCPEIDSIAYGCLLETPN